MTATKSERIRAAVVGAVGGTALGFLSLELPVFLNPRFALEPGVTTFTVIGLGILGAIFGVMTRDAQ